MCTYLLIDIGAGTMDVLYYDASLDLHYKALVISPVPYLSEKVRNQSGKLVITGKEMGGGALAGILKERALQKRVVMSRSASATLHHDWEKVASWGTI